MNNKYESIISNYPRVRYRDASTLQQPPKFILYESPDIIYVRPINKNYLKRCGRSLFLTRKTGMVNLTGRDLNSIKKALYNADNLNMYNKCRIVEFNGVKYIVPKSKRLHNQKHSVYYKKPYSKEYHSRKLMRIVKPDSITILNGVEINKIEKCLMHTGEIDGIIDTQKCKIV